METIILKNGATEAMGLVTATMLALTDLMKTKPMMFYEFVEKCKDPTHKIWGDFGIDLRRMSLLEQNFQPHGSVRNIVLSAVEGEGLDMTIVNPAKLGKMSGIGMKQG